MAHAFPRSGELSMRLVAAHEFRKGCPQNGRPFCILRLVPDGMEECPSALDGFGPERLACPRVALGLHDESSDNAKDGFRPVANCEGLHSLPCVPSRLEDGHGFGDEGRRGLDTAGDDSGPVHGPTRGQRQGDEHEIDSSHHATCTTDTTLY